MDEIIQLHNFEDAKQKIKEFSEQPTAEVFLRKSDTGKSFGEFFGDVMLGRGLGLNHKVTGEEFNDLVSDVQKHLINVNNTQISMIKEFGVIYSALESLDKDYIQAIWTAIKATEKTSEGIKHTQAELQRVVDNQTKTVEMLKKFKQRLDSYKHLGDIDSLWADFQEIAKGSSKLENSVAYLLKSDRDNSQRLESLAAASKSASANLSNLNSKLDTVSKKLGNVIETTSAIAALAHIADVDKMWEMSLDAHESIVSINSEIASLQQIISAWMDDMDSLAAFKEELSKISHLSDVDGMWESVESHSERLSQLDRRSEELSAQAQEITSELNSASERIDANSADISGLIEYRERLDGISHLTDVDGMWESVESHSERLSQLDRRSEELYAQAQEITSELNSASERIDANSADISGLIEYRERLDGISHLSDVDGMWESVESHSERLSQLDRRSEELSSTISQSHDEYESKINQLTQQIESAANEMSKKIKLAYIIAGGAAGTAIIELIFILLKVI